MPTTNNLEGWERGFDEKYTFTEDGIKYLKFDYHSVYKNDGDIEQRYTKAEPLKQFISALRQADCEALIKIIIEEIQPFGRLKGLEKAIKDYYNK